VNDPDARVTDFSLVEILLLNLIMFKALSTSFRRIAHHLEKMGELKKESRRDRAAVVSDTVRVRESEHGVAMNTLKVLSGAPKSRRNTETLYDSDDEEGAGEEQLPEETITSRSSLSSNPLNRGILKSV
jgi:hypothetical protein